MIFTFHFGEEAYKTPTDIFIEHLKSIDKFKVALVTYIIKRSYLAITLLEYF